MFRTPIFVLVVFLSADAYSQTYEGTIEYSSGSAWIESKAGKAQAQKGAHVQAGDQLSTDAGALVIFTMNDGASFKLKEKSAIRVPTDRENELDLRVGSIFSQIPKQKKGLQFKVKTPTAVMGVRGTRFFTSYDNDLWMCVNEGAVEVTSLATRKEELVQQGEGVELESGKDLTPPKKYEWTKQLNWNMDPAQGDVVDRTKIDYDKELLKHDYD